MVGFRLDVLQSYVTFGSDYIVHAKETIDRLEDQRQDILSKKQQARDDLDAMLQERDTRT